jgi:hypothetical protein
LINIAAVKGEPDGLKPRLDRHARRYLESFAGNALRDVRAESERLYRVFDFLNLRVQGTNATGLAGSGSAD